MSSILAVVHAYICGLSIFVKHDMTITQHLVQTGRKLLLESTNERFSTAILISLTKVASRWTVMIPEQTELLFLFLKDGASSIEATVLECLHFILAKGICPCSATTDKIQYLISRLDESQFPRDLHNQTLKVLHKILFHNFPILPCSVMLEFSSVLLNCIVKTMQCSLMSTRLLAFAVLVDISEVLLRKVQKELCEAGLSMVSQVICIIMDRISLCVKSKLCIREVDAEMYQEVMRLLNLLSILVKTHPHIDCVLVDKLCAFLEYVVNVLGREISLNQEGNVNFQILKLGQEKMTIVLLKVALRVAVMITGLETVTTSGVMSQVQNLLKHLVEKSHNSAKAKTYIIRLYMLLFQSDGNNMGLWQGIKQSVNSDSKSSPGGDSYSQQGFHNTKFVMELFESQDFWSCYMAGKFVACQGSWCTAAGIFAQLVPMVQSDLCSSWLKSLTLFSCSESEIQTLAFGLPKDIFGVDTEGIAWKSYLTRNAEKITRACHTLRAAKETLGTTITGIRFSFQVWFLSLRVKVLETWADICTLLDTISFIQDGSSGVANEELLSTPKLMLSQGLGAFLNSCMQISSRLKRTAQEFDLMTASVIDLDRKCVMIISALALSCSVLAFSLTFALSIPNLSSKEYEDLDIPKEQHSVNLIEELIGRLGSVDPESGKALWKFLKIYKNPNSCFYPGIQNHGAKISGETKDYVQVCRYAVMEIVRQQSELSGLCCPEGFSRISFDGLQLLLSIIAKLIQIPFRTPERFFLVRSYASSELYVMNEEGQNLAQNPVISGSHCQLNLCLQLRDMPSDLSFHISKLYCALRFVRVTQKDIEVQSSCISGQSDLDDIIDLHEKLLRYVNGSVKSDGGDVEANEDSYIRFDHNERGQGFATLLLDISALPVGIHRIKWLGCCIDGEGSYCNLLPLNNGPVFSVVMSS